MSHLRRRLRHFKGRLNLHTSHTSVSECGLNLRAKAKAPAKVQTINDSLIMAITKQQKEEILADLIDKFSNAKSVAFGQYDGMSVDELSTMRREMRESNVEFKVAKKTLLKLAAKEQGLELPDDIIEGTIGAVFSYDDAVSGPRIVRTTAKKVEVLKLMGGIMEGKILSIDEMNELSSLPSRDQLLAKFMMMIWSPLQSFHGAISSPLSSFARAMSAYADQMPDEGASAPEPAAAPAEKAEEATKEEEKPAEQTKAEAEVAEPKGETTPEAKSEGASEETKEAEASEETAPAEEAEEKTEEKAEADSEEPNES